MQQLQSIKQRFGIIGRSPLLERALGTAIRVAPTDLTVLIIGESGVGKEVFSKIIHALSARKHNQFIAINCGAIPEGTINSELFGHEKGSFTGATAERKGYFETYDGGTIFLDEIGEMPLDTQAFLLRVLESGEYIRVGSSKVLSTDVRIIAATNANLPDLVKKGRFREDLYYRLNTVPINVPALRERREDIPLLFRKFALDFAEKYRTEAVVLDEQAGMLLVNYNWPGNIRELRNVSEQLSVLAETREISADDLIKIIPGIMNRNLPMIPEKGSSGAGDFQEREILYKLLFDMKSDLNDLKSLVFELIKTNDLRVSDSHPLPRIERSLYSGNEHARMGGEKSVAPPFQGVREDVEERELEPEAFRPILLDNKSHVSYDSMELVDENLSLEENEKELIKRALKKHLGKRKEAAEDLGISERTLYRKIKQYDLQ
jgi:DNA-binding NtrC family response regulator